MSLGLNGGVLNKLLYLYDSRGLQGHSGIIQRYVERVHTSHGASVQVQVLRTPLSMSHCILQLSRLSAAKADPTDERELHDSAIMAELTC